VFIAATLVNPIAPPHAAHPFPDTGFGAAGVGVAAGLEAAAGAGAAPPCFVPHSGQNLAPAIDAPQFVQKPPAAAFGFAGSGSEPNALSNLLFVGLGFEEAFGAAATAAGTAAGLGCAGRDWVEEAAGAPPAPVTSRVKYLAPD